jgi:PadR family transcriptional regulator PadR
MARKLGEFEQLILFAIVRLADNAYGLSIWREIEDRTGKDVASGAIYTALDRLEKRGMVSSLMGDPTAERGGRRRKHYCLEQQGAEVLGEAYSNLQKMAHGMGSRVAAIAEGEVV